MGVGRVEWNEVPKSSDPKTGGILDRIEMLRALRLDGRVIDRENKMTATMKEWATKVSAEGQVRRRSICRREQTWQEAVVVEASRNHKGRDFFVGPDEK